jgi:hypothetical protein
LQSDVPADALDGVRALYTSRMTEAVRNSWANWALFFAQQAEKNGQVALQAEAIRTIGMFEPSDPKITEYLFAQIDNETHPTSDIHTLCSLAQCGSKRTEEQTLRTAGVLAQIVKKIKGRGLYTDNQWPARLKQLIGAINKKDTGLGAAYAALSEPLSGDDLVIVNAFSEEIQNLIKQRVMRDLRSLPLDRWDVSIIKFAFNGTIDPTLRESFRKACEMDSLRSTCLEILAKEPEESEYELYVNALESSDRLCWASAWQAISKIDRIQAAREFPLLAKLLSVCLNSSVSLPKESVMRRARLVAKELQKPEPPTSELWKDWQDYFAKELPESQQAELLTINSKFDLDGLAAELKNTSGDGQRGKVLYQA